MSNEFIYLHGFASSPYSAKARYLLNGFALANIKLEIPDLNAGDFSHLTISRQITQVATEFLSLGVGKQEIAQAREVEISSTSSSVSFPSPSVTLIGSSLGGLTAAHLGQQYLQVERLILLAPAFGFLSHWLPQLGDEKIQRWRHEKYLMVHHYEEERELPLSYDFVVDATQYKEGILQRSIPTLILHGIHDEVIPIQASRDFALKRPWVELVELDSDHSLGNVMGEIWQTIRLFCRIP